MIANLTNSLRTLDAQRCAALVVLIGGALNGLAVRMIEAHASGGFTGSLLGVTLFEIITISVAASLVWGGQTRDRQARPGAAELIAATALLVPSSALSWGVVAAYAGHLAWRSDGPARLGALLFLSLAASSIWSSVALKWLALPLTSAEAAAVGLLLGLFKDGVVQVANVVGVPSEHSLIVMSACSTADGLPRALVGLAAVLVLADRDLARWFVPSAIVFALIYVTANLLRLTLMAWSWDLYTVGHGPLGAGLFDAATTAAVFAVVLGGERR